MKYLAFESLQLLCGPTYYKLLLRFKENLLLKAIFRVHVCLISYWLRKILPSTCFLYHLPVVILPQWLNGSHQQTTFKREVKLTMIEYVDWESTSSWGLGATRIRPVFNWIKKSSLAPLWIWNSTCPLAVSGPSASDVFSWITTSPR